MSTIILENVTIEKVIEELEEKGYGMEDFNQDEAVKNGYFGVYMDEYQDIDCFNLSEKDGLYTLSVD